MSFTKALISADDWGMSPGVNEGILALAQKGIIRRVSLLANGKFLEHELKALLEVPQIQCGLHLNFTFEKPLSSLGRSPWVQPKSSLFWNRTQLFFRWQLYKKDRPLLFEEAKRQFEQLENLNVKIKHIDGHEHIHLLPGLMELVMPLLKSRSLFETRLPLDRQLYFSPKFPVLWLALAAQSNFQKLGLQWHRFAYPQQKHFASSQIFEKWISDHPRHEILVHPAKTMDFVALNILDPYQAQRVREFKMLSALTE